MNLCRNNANTAIALVAGIFCVLMLSAFGCGRKAMPVAPNKYVPPVVADLNGKIEGNQLMLFWTMPSEKGQGKSDPAAVVVYRSKVSMKESACPDCPPRFEPIAELTSISESGKEMRYVDALDAGYRYTYKVVLVGKNNVIGAASNFFVTLF